jgi:hypothetical protein
LIYSFNHNITVKPLDALIISWYDPCNGKSILERYIMAATIIQARGLSNAELEELKAKLKPLGFTVNVRRHAAKYVLGYVDLRPSKASGWSFTASELDKVIAVVEELGMRIAQMDLLRGDNRAYIFASGITYAFKVAA